MTGDVDVLTALSEQFADLAAILDGLDEQDWHRPSPCEGWDVRDVLLHLAQTDELAVASVEGRMEQALLRLAENTGPAATIDEGAAVMVERERGEPGPAVRARWQQGVDDLMSLFDAADPRARVTWVAGQLSVRTLATTRLAETWIHTGDITEALGGASPLTDRLQLIARLAWRTVPYAFERSGLRLAGPVAFELEGPSGDNWSFVPDETPVTTVRGPAVDLCLVAARRVDPAATDLKADGPDAEAVLRLVRTYA